MRHTISCCATRELSTEPEAMVSRRIGFAGRYYRAHRTGDHRCGHASDRPGRSRRRPGIYRSAHACDPRNLPGPTADNYVRQGVTTIMEGPDGGSPVPLKPFLDKLAALQKSLNVGSFLGQGSVRAAVIGLIDRPATAGEIDRMRALVLQGMRDGAFGLSTGLFYVPGIFTPTCRSGRAAKSGRAMARLAHVAYAQRGGRRSR